MMRPEMKYCCIAAVIVAASSAHAAEKRVNDLVAQMTLEEKIGQTVQDSSGPSSAAESQDASDRKVAQDFLARLTRGGSEVVQIYVRDRIAPVTRPVRELKGFTRVDLKPGESRRVTVKVPVSSFAFHQDGRRVAGQGRFDAWIAPDSVSGRTLCFELP